MKKIICFLLMITMLFATGCTQNTAIDENTVNVEQLLKEYVNNVDQFETPIRQVGEPTSYISMEENMAVGIFYPETDVKSLNMAIENWIEDTVKYYKEDVLSTSDEDSSSELTVTYSSYLINDEISTVKLKGTFISSQMAHPVDIAKVFMTKGKDIITITDIIKEKEFGNFAKLIASKAGVQEELIDKEFLENTILTNNGVEVVLERGKYLPMSDGTVEIKLSYDEAKKFLEEDFDFVQKEELNIETEKVELPAPSEIDPNKPMVALTFDDGPSVHTKRLLDIYKKHGGKGTFFVLGYLVKGNEDVLKRAVSEGHELGNHSWDHSQLTNLSDEQLTDQIMQTRAVITAATGIDTKIMRPPYGACNEEVLKIGKNLDVSFVNWSVDTLDWKTRNADAIYNEIMNNVSDGSIILCHDLHGTTVDAMERVIPDLIAKEYQLVTVTELLEYGDGAVEPGKMYYRK